MYSFYQLFLEDLEIVRIDVSKAFFDSYGKREIVIYIEDSMQMMHKKREARFVFPKYLRLHTDNYEEQLGNFLVLRDKMFEDYRKQIYLFDDTPQTIRYKPKIIDLRISKLAFIDQNN